MIQENTPFHNSAIKTKVSLTKKVKKDDSSLSLSTSLPKINTDTMKQPPNKLESFRKEKVYIKHPTIKPPKHFFSNAKNQYFIESKVNATHKYQSVSSFERKLNKELSRISNKYGKVGSLQNFYHNKNLDTFWSYVPEFSQYVELKKIENRFSPRQDRPKLKPLVYITKDNLNKLASKLFNLDKYGNRYSNL